MQLRYRKGSGNCMNKTYRLKALSEGRRPTRQKANQQRLGLGGQREPHRENQVWSLDPVLGLKGALVGFRKEESWD